MRLRHPLDGSVLVPGTCPPGGDGPPACRPHARTGHSDGGGSLLQLHEGGADDVPGRIGSGGCSGALQSARAAGSQGPLAPRHRHQM
ncbi:hypothetical protein AVEN_37428-1, partial [Araneus ventricosus]